MSLQSLNKANGKLVLNYQLDNQGRQFCRFYQQEPLRALFPLMPDIAVPAAVLINTSGGIAGGDHHTLHIQIGESAKALMTTQAAEKIYCSSFACSHIHTQIKTGENSWFEWVPQETIIFNGGRLCRSLSFHISPLSAAMGGEIVIFGRVNRGEKFQFGFLQDEWSIYWGADLIWKDLLLLEEDSTFIALEHPAAFDQATAYATFVYIADKAEQYLEIGRRFLKGCKTRHYVTSFSNLLLVRWLSSDPFQLRREYARFWCFWRNKVVSLPRALPRIWSF